MKVLLADDDPVTRRVLAAQLKSWGYEVVAVADGTAAWAALEGPDAPALALLDWEMPGIDGIELCRRVRAIGREPYTYVYLVTSRDGRQDVLAGLDAGADDYLTKPCDAAQLAARLRVGKRITTMHQELVAAREALRHRALHDGLTGALNRSGVLEALHAEAAALGRRGGTLGVAMVDLDHFKRVNDTFGHAAGDAVLRESVHRIRAALRPYDRLGRMGGEEFLLVLPDCDGEALRSIAERIRAAIADTPFRSGATCIPVTCSVGVGTVTDPADALGMVSRADAALYAAKSAGRNRVVEAG